MLTAVYLELPLPHLLQIRRNSRRRNSLATAAAATAATI
jgi:hypothetical protein